MNILDFLWSAVVVSVISLIWLCRDSKDRFKRYRPDGSPAWRTRRGKTINPKCPVCGATKIYRSPTSDESFCFQCLDKEAQAKYGIQNCTRERGHTGPCNGWSCREQRPTIGFSPPVNIIDLLRIKCPRCGQGDRTRFLFAKMNGTRTWTCECGCVWEILLYPPNMIDKDAEFNRINVDFEKAQSALAHETELLNASRIKFRARVQHARQMIDNALLLADGELFDAERRYAQEAARFVEAKERFREELSRLLSA